MHLDPEAAIHFGTEIAASPAHHLVRLHLRSVDDKGLEFLPLLLAEDWRSTGALTRCQPGNPLAVVAMDPVAQGLPVRAIVPRRLRAGGAVQHRRNRQQAADHLRITTFARQLPQIRRRMIVTSDLDCLSHDAPRIGSGLIESGRRIGGNPQRVSVNGGWYKIS